MAKNPFSGEILHFGAVRYRVTGSGNLQSSLKTLDDTTTDTLANIAMAATTDVEPLLLANLTSQKAYIKFQTTNIDEVFSINRIVIFIKPVATGYPQ